jgi:hypothetical protein
MRSRSQIAQASTEILTPSENPAGDKEMAAPTASRIAPASISEEPPTSRLGGV